MLGKENGFQECWDLALQLLCNEDNKQVGFFLATELVLVFHQRESHSSFSNKLPSICWCCNCIGCCAMMQKMLKVVAAGIAKSTGKYENIQVFTSQICLEKYVSEKAMRTIALFLYRWTHFHALLIPHCTAGGKNLATASSLSPVSPPHAHPTLLSPPGTSKGNGGFRTIALILLCSSWSGVYFCCALINCCHFKATWQSILSECNYITATFVNVMRTYLGFLT